MPEKEKTYIRTCGKSQEAVGSPCTHSFPTTLLPDCKHQSPQPCSSSLLCHPQRPALNFHLVERWQKASFREESCSLKKVDAPEWKSWGVLVGRSEVGKESSRGSLWQWSLISTLLLRKQKILPMSRRVSPSHVMGSAPMATAEQAANCFSELKWNNSCHSVKELGNL